MDAWTPEEREIWRLWAVIRQLQERHPMTLTDLQKLVYKTQTEHFPANENIDQKLLLMVGEITEAQNELRAGRDVTAVYFEPPTPDVMNEKPEGFPIELADVIIRALNTLSDYGLDAEELILLKDAYNQKRPYMHGKGF